MNRVEATDVPCFKQDSCYKQLSTGSAVHNAHCASRIDRVKLTCAEGGWCRRQDLDINLAESLQDSCIKGGSIPDQSPTGHPPLSKQQ